VIAIDGPGAAGKSTVARLLARRLGTFVFDTGALYRAVTLLALPQGIAPNDAAALTVIANDLDITMAPPTVDDGRQVNVQLGDEDVTWALRTPEIDAAVSEVSAHQGVRAALLPVQRRIADGAAVVMVGRDIGTVVAPDAGTKFYLDASAEERARRRLVDLQRQGVETDFASVLKDLRARDAWDAGRDLSPLRPAEDAIIIHSDGRTAEEIAVEMATIAKERWAALTARGSRA
jgi:cytidylate kinase